MLPHQLEEASREESQRERSKPGGKKDDRKTRWDLLPPCNSLALTAVFRSRLHQIGVAGRRNDGRRPGAIRIVRASRAYRAPFQGRRLNLRPEAESLTTSLLASTS